jgi:hypothetical protein
MTEIKHTPGSFCWIELGTTDAAAAKQFYTGLFGWGFADQAMGPNEVYTLLQIAGKDVAGLYQLNEQQRSQGIRPHWLSYVSVSSADESAEKAQSLGGKVIMAPFDVFDLGRMALVEDPTGATFALWQPRKHTGAQFRDQPNTLCWNELATRDTAAAAQFYTNLFGWSAKADQNGPMSYTEFTNQGHPIGGMMQISAECGEIPPHWLIYFAVEDCDRSTDRARQLGGEVKRPPTDIPGVGRFAVIQDPPGAVFAIIKLSHAA